MLKLGMVRLVINLRKNEVIHFLNSIQESDITKRLEMFKELFEQLEMGDTLNSSNHIILDIASKNQDWREEFEEMENLKKEMEDSKNDGNHIKQITLFFSVRAIYDTHEEILSTFVEGKGYAEKYYRPFRTKFGVDDYHDVHST